MNRVAFEIMQHEGDGGYEDDDVWLDPAIDPMSYTPREDLVDGVAIMSVSFADVITGTVSEDEGAVLNVPFVAGYFRSADSYVNIVSSLCYAGDADADGDVDDDDLSLLLAHWGQDTDCQYGEFSGVVPVNDDDLSLLLANWTGSTVIPEPATLSLLAVSAMILQRHRRGW